MRQGKIILKGEKETDYDLGVETDSVYWLYDL